MFIQATAFLCGKDDAISGRKFNSIFEPGSEAAMDYARGYKRGLEVMEGIYDNAI